MRARLKMAIMALCIAFAATADTGHLQYKGGYLWEAYSPESKSNLSGSGTVIGFTEDSVELKGFFRLSYIPFKAKIVGDSIYISPNTIVSNSPYGPAVARRYAKQGNEWVADANSPVRGVFENGNVKIIDNAALVVVAGSNTGMRLTYITDAYSAERANGAITAPLNVHSPTPLSHEDSYPVQILQAGSQVLVQNFCNLGKETLLTINLLNGDTAVIRSQMTIMDMQRGLFCTYSADFNKQNTTNLRDFISSNNIECHASKKQITWGNWMIASERECYGLYNSGALLFVDENEFHLNLVESIADDASIVSVRYFDVSGKELPSPQAGINIVVSVYSNGSTHSEKKFLNP